MAPVRFALPQPAKAGTGLQQILQGADGRYPEGSVNRRVDDRLAAFAEKARNFGRGAPAANGAKTEAPKPPEPAPPGPPPPPPADPPRDPGPRD